MAFQAGYNKGVTLQVSGFAAGVLNIKGHSWSEQIDALDITHTGHAGIQALLAGILRGDGNVKADLDGALAPPNVGIRAGANALMLFNLGTTTPYQVPLMITKVNYASVVEGKVEYDFDVRLNTEAGAMIRPT